MSSLCIRHYRLSSSAFFYILAFFFETTGAIGTNLVGIFIVGSSTKIIISPDLEAWLSFSDEKNVWRPSVLVCMSETKFTTAVLLRVPKKLCIVLKWIETRWLSSPLIGRAIFPFLRSTVCKVSRHWTEVNFTGPNNKNWYYL